MRYRMVLDVRSVILSQTDTHTLPPDSFEYCACNSTRTTLSKAGFTAAASKYSGTASECTC